MQIIILCAILYCEITFLSCTGCSDFYSSQTVDAKASQSGNSRLIEAYFLTSKLSSKKIWKPLKSHFFSIEIFKSLENIVIHG